MKLSEINNVELNSLLNLTEKYMEHLAKHVRMNEHRMSEQVNEMNKKYMSVNGKYVMILEEINKRLNNIE